MEQEVKKEFVSLDSLRRSRREQEEDYTPLWIRIFGGSILSIAFLCVITLTGYIVSNINNLQSQINVLNSDVMTRKDFNDRQTAMWTTLNSSIKTNYDEKFNALDQVSKDRQVWVEKLDIRIKDQDKILESLNKEIAGHKERSALLETQLNQYRDENRQLQKDLQSLRERVAALEGKTKKE